MINSAPRMSSRDPAWQQRIQHFALAGDLDILLGFEPLLCQAIIVVSSDGTLELSAGLLLSDDFQSEPSGGSAEASGGTLEPSGGSRETAVGSTESSDSGSL